MSNDLIEELSDGVAMLTVYRLGTRCFIAQGHKDAAQSFVDKVAQEFLSRQNYVG